MRRTGLINRLDRISTTQGQGAVVDLARRIAEHDGLSVTEIITETERIADACHQQGITSTEGMVRYVATELGITAEELAAEMTRYRELME